MHANVNIHCVLISNFCENGKGKNFFICIRQPFFNYSIQERMGARLSGFLKLIIGMMRVCWVF